MAQSFQKLAARCIRCFPRLRRWIALGDLRLLVHPISVVAVETESQKQLKRQEEKHKEVGRRHDSPSPRHQPLYLGRQLNLKHRQNDTPDRYDERGEEQDQIENRQDAYSGFQHVVLAEAYEVFQIAI